MGMYGFLVTYGDYKIYSSSSILYRTLDACISAVKNFSFDVPDNFPFILRYFKVKDIWKGEGKYGFIIVGEDGGINEVCNGLYGSFERCAEDMREICLENDKKTLVVFKEISPGMKYYKFSKFSKGEKAD